MTTSSTYTDISTRAAQALEWPKFLRLAQNHARTEQGKKILLDLMDSKSWATHLNIAQIQQQQTQEALLLLDRNAIWDPLTDLLDPQPIIERLYKNSILETSELALIRRWLYAVDSWIQIPRDEIRGEWFKRSLQQLPDPYQALQILDRVLTPENELSERASPKLSSLFQEIRHLKKEIGNVLDQLMKTFSQKGVLQENFTDLRDGRYVIPIKISSQGEVDGIIYEASASRQTVFVEPREVASLNNRLRQKQNELIQEIYQILAEVSEKLAPFTQEIETAVSILAHWDSIQAKARFGLTFGGKTIRVVDTSEFQLYQTAHPLLWWSLSPDQIIRNHIEFADPIRCLLLTGPNTGGKTVLLKTIGLAGLCAKTGFPFPGAEQTIIPFFENFFADLGDPQSIEQHLSSFSGHILRFKEILENLTDRSLILLDELNSATDPEEGAALGRAFLETIMSRGATIITTTHDPHLKAMGISDPRILNASMQFDESARTPTYKMVFGVPGRSRALETAERLGISNEVLDLAKKYLSQEHLEFEKLLSKLEKDIQETSQARKEAVGLRDEAERLKKEWTEKTETSVNDMLEKTRMKLRRILEQAQDEVRASVKKLDEMRNRKELDQTRGKLNQVFTESALQVEKALEEEAPEIAKNLEITKKTQVDRKETPQTKFQEGSTVRVPKWKTTATILKIENKKVKVAMGALQMTLGIDEIEPMTSPLPPQKVKINVEHQNHLKPELDLRGLRLDEAMTQLESYLDQVYRSESYVEIVIIHGLGTGALREGTRKILNQLPYVKNFRDGGASQGNTGATIVEFDR